MITGLFAIGAGVSVVGLLGAVAQLDATSFASSRDADELRGCASALIAFATLLAGWAYAMATYGWFLGLALGWIPAGIIAGIAFVVWPWVFLVVGGIAMYAALTAGA